MEAIPYARKSIAAALVAARREAGLTVAQLAEKLGKPVAVVTAGESGEESVGETYILAVLKACGLPKDWKPSASR